jgi:D-lactate dehydrogenase
VSEQASLPLSVLPSLQQTLAARLGQFMDPARVLTRPIDRIAYASDASLYRLIPLVIAQPVDREEVRRIFALSHELGVPLTFRAAGTSLSGQAITDGILVDIGSHFRGAKVEEQGRALRVQPGLVGEAANQMLKLYGKKIGPDPASIAAARLGGMLANNASGMCCGVEQNSYHTLQSMTFLLPSGTEIDTALPEAEETFARQEPELCAGLLRIKHELEANPALAARIRNKYRMKNTTGYGLNAFLDFETPAAIFSHLLIGSEGTLGFIAEAVLKTVTDLPVKYTGLLLFPNLHAACAAIDPLKAAGAAALELMDYASLLSVQNEPGIPVECTHLPEGAAALLVEWQTANQTDAAQNAARAEAAVAGLELLAPAGFTSDAREQADLWHIRKGIFPAVGAVRAERTTAVIEDVVFPTARLADAAIDLQKMMQRHGYTNGIIYGHAKDGNLHFVLTPGFNSEREIAQYKAFIDDVVELVVKKYDGALKAEHGTGRNMAPFVETEWGPEAYALMQQLKQLADPRHLLNPGVILNTNPAAHITGLKTMPVIEAVADKCIECGYCEAKCPSRDLTLTPRRRIVVRRELQRLKDSGAGRQQFDALDKDFPYMALETCAADGLCATACPVHIDTGKLVKHFRHARHTALARWIALQMARNLTLVEFGGRMAITVGHLVQRTLGLGTMVAITGALDKLTRATIGEAFWKWSKEMPRPRKGPLPVRLIEDAEAVYFPACISRIMGALPGEPDETSVMQAFLHCADRAGVKLYVPAEAGGNCCGMPFGSKGFDEAHAQAVGKTVENFYRWTKGGALPVVVDTSPCSYTLKTAREHLTDAQQKMFDKLTIYDSVEYAHDRLLPQLKIARKVFSVALHPVCSVTKMGSTEKLRALAAACSDNVLIPADAGCCGFAGDRGFLFPELTASATRGEAAQATEKEQWGYFSSSRTCEVGMTRSTGKIYRSYLHLLDYATR